MGRCAVGLEATWAGADIGVLSPQPGMVPDAMTAETALADTCFALGL